MTAERWRTWRRHCLRCSGESAVEMTGHDLRVDTADAHLNFAEIAELPADDLLVDFRELAR